MGRRNECQPGQPPLNRRRSAGAILVPLAIVIGLIVVGVYVVRDVQHHGIGLPGSSSGKLAGNALTKKVDGFNTTINALAVQAQLAQALDHSTTNYVQRISCSLQASSGKGSNATHDRYICVVAYFKGPQRRWCATFDSYHSELAGYSSNTRLCNRA